MKKSRIELAYKREILKALKMGEKGSIGAAAHFALAGFLLKEWQEEKKLDKCGAER